MLLCISYNKIAYKGVATTVAKNSHYLIKYVQIIDQKRNQQLQLCSRIHNIEILNPLIILDAKK